MILVRCIAVVLAAMLAAPLPAQQQPELERIRTEKKA